MGIKKFQEDLQKGMTLEEALKKHKLSLKEAVELCPKPFRHRKPIKKPYRKRNMYKTIDTHIVNKKNGFYVRKTLNGKSFWGGSYNTLEDAQKIRDYLDEHGWNVIKIREACKKLNIERRTR